MLHADPEVVEGSVRDGKEWNDGMVEYWNDGRRKTWKDGMEKME